MCDNFIERMIEFWNASIKRAQMSRKEGSSIKWKPRRIYSHETLFKFALVVLNRPIGGDYEVVMSLWKRAAIKILVDGGANQWYNFLESRNLPADDKSFIPDFITGDFDSISQEVLDHFRSHGAKIIHTPDQNETDFTKALRFLSEHWKNEMSQVEAVIAIAETCGRFDQIMANINTLFKAKDLLDPPVYQVASDSVTWILWPGEHEIELIDEKVSCSKWCSLIPIGSCCSRVKTSGLKWNLDSQPLEFGRLVSTSNTYSPGCSAVTISTNGPLVWSMET